LYHSVNTRYNIYFNAEQAYREALKAKQESHTDTLSQIINVFPASVKSSNANTPASRDFERDNRSFSSPKSGSDYSSTNSYSNQQSGGGSFSRSIDKNTKAIKLHSIKSKPERNPNKKRDPKYQAWLKQQEFNPFLKNAWLLLGKSEYQDGDYLQSISTFAYITRLYKTDAEVVAEARMWMVKANVAMGWTYEAEDILNQIRLAGGILPKLKPEYDKIYADFWIKQGKYAQAVPYLDNAIQQERDGLQKTRLKYLLGQIYKELGDPQKAYAAFDAVHGLNTPYFYSFNARIQQASFADGNNRLQILAMLDKMAKDPKNKEYLDQVYYAKGNIYLNSLDTVNAIKNYKESIARSTRGGYDKALSDVALGGIYFAKKEYTNAQPCYSSALNGLSKRHPAYTSVALRSAVLDELVVHVEAVHLQDSLQALGQMPEAERLDVLNKLIAELRKKEKEEKSRSNREALLLQREQNTPISSPIFTQNIPSMPVPSTPSFGNNFGETSSFYFYNQQVVTQGKASFQRQWGNRKLEDNWRRKSKEVAMLLANQKEADQSKNDSMPAPDISAISGSTAEADIYSIDFYLQQIPMAPDDITASNVIIEDAYFNMGKIYKDKLEDYNLAVDAFDTDLRRFPNTPNLQEIYYQLLLIYLKLGNKEMTEHYRRNILNTFPKGAYASSLSDPNYAWNMLNMHKLEDALYQETYELYLAGKVSEVRANYASIKEKNPLSSLMPKFMFLNALTYAQRNDANEFKSNLQDLITAYPDAEVTPVATEMLRGIMSGRQLSSDNSPFRGMIWDIKFGGDTLGLSEGLDFVAKAETSYMLLFVYTAQLIDKNQLIYEVANYNFSNYIYQTFDLAFSQTNSLEMMQVKGFKNLKDIVSYVDKAFAKNSLMSQLDPSIIPIPISDDNYIALMNGRTINEYFIFLEKNYTKEMISLIRYWGQQRNKGAGQTLPKTETSSALRSDVSPQNIPEPTPTPVVVDSAEQLLPQVIPVSPILPHQEKAKARETKEEFGFDKVMSDDQIEKMDNVINKVSDLISNPVDGIKGIFKSSGSSSNLSKEEKQAEKEARKREEAGQKNSKAVEEARIKAEKEVEKMRQDSVQAVRNKAEVRIINKVSKQNDTKLIEKEKEASRKEKVKELKLKEKARQEALKQRERQRKELLKQKERQREERLKKQEAARKVFERKGKQENR
jgi:tetratricopeptide (TPR) repeat protein